ncbi:MAG: type I-B CRISPR-associated endonuclease Cas1, partial [Bacilli bacterium]|nr:type I-B CRISPR-associated endonuclease Cas1 [Bacilli bacterium]
MSKQSYYIFSSGELKRRNDSLTLYVDGILKKDIPIERVKDLYVFSEVTYNTKLFQFLGEKGITVHMFNYYNFYVGSFCPKEVLVSGNVLVLQVEHYLQYEKRVMLAKKFISAAIYNILRNLKYYQTRGKDLKDYIEKIENLEEGLESCNTVPEVMGIEGNVRKIYYSAWNTILNVEVDFKKRVKRPPDNMINSLISFLNSIFYTKVLSEIYQTQLNPTISYLHEPGNKRFSLSLDVSEVFKPIIVDRTIFSLLNKKIISEKDFVEEDNFLRIKDSGVKKIMEEMENTLSRTIMHRKLKREVSY